MSIVRRIARPLLASSFIATGIETFRNPAQAGAELETLIEKADRNNVINQDAQTIAKIIGGTQIGAGALLALGKFPRLSSLALVLTMAPAAVVEFKQATVTNKAERDERRKTLLKNLSLMGGVMLASVDTAGKPGLWWRAQHAGTATKRQLQQMQKEVERQAASLQRSAQGAIER